MKIQGYAVKSKGGHLEPFEYEAPAMGEADVLVDISHCGLCHTHVHFIDDEFGLTRYPFVPGHEIVGTVAAAGRAVRTLKEGWSCPDFVDMSELRKETETCHEPDLPIAPELRQKIVDLARAGRNAASLAREFEPTETTIRNWIAQADRDAGVRSDGLTTDERKELNQLRRENRTLREEREILKKAAAWFAQETGATPRRPSAT